jgi:hypothetical protein
MALLAAAALGQTGLATITGIVSDPNGAVVAGAAIEARHMETGLLYRSSSTETGNFTVTQLPVGPYELAVEVPGFKKYTRQGIVLAAAQVLRNDVSLEIGAVTETVTVTGEATLLKTENGELAHQVTLSQLDNLPVLAIGGSGTSAPSGMRNPWGLAVLIPGTQFISDSRMIVNGVPQNTASYRVEGMDSGHNGGLRTFTQMMQPSVDAIQEVSVQTSNYAAEFGTAGGGIFNTTMKSGGNRYHGSLYDYAVNEALNAHQPYTGARSSQKRHDYGGTMGGPVILPRLYDGRNRTFFFWSYEQFRENLRVRDAPIGGFPSVPVPAYRAGDFSQVIIGSGLNGIPRPLQVAGRDYVDPLGRGALSGMIFDPGTERTVTSGGQNFQVRDPFPGNAINPLRFDPVAVKIQNLIPLPQGPTANQLGANYQRAWISHRTSDLPSIKFDHNVSSKGKVSFYWGMTDLQSQYSAPLGSMEGFPEPITGARGTFLNTRTIRLNYDHALTPTILLHFGAGYQRHDFDDHSPVTSYNAEKELGLRGATLHSRFPVFTANTGGVATGGMSGMGPTAGQNPNSEIKPAANASLTWVRGNHTLKIGGEFRATGYSTYSLSNTSGNYTLGAGATQQTALQGVVLSQGSTGFGYASFLLGHVTAVTLAVPLAARTGQQQWTGFAQDTWKVARKLTLDYGLRWDYGTYAREQYGRNADFSPTTANPSAGGHPGGSIFEATCNCNFAHNYPHAWGPRLGVAYQVNSRTVLRGGLGIVYDQTLYQGAGGVNSQNGGTPPFGQWLFNLRDGIPASVNPVWPVFNPGLYPAPGTVGVAPAFLDPNAGRPARQTQWSVSLQREIGRNLVVEASYVANRGAWWGAAGLSAHNVISEQLLAKYGFTNFSSIDESRLLTTNISVLTPNQRATLASRGVVLPYSGFPTGQTVRQSLLPFPQFTSAINPVNAPLGRTWYDSLQVTVTKRYSYGLSLNANYTYGKALDLVSSPDIFNRQLGKNLSTLADIPHQLRMSAQYTVPRIRAGGGILGNKVLQYALADWGLGAYVQYQSGALLGRPASTGLNPISNFLGRGPGPAQLKAGMSPWAVDWVDYDGKRHTEPIDINCHCFDPTRTRVLNPAAWENIPDGQWGAQQGVSSMRYYRNFRQPDERMNFSRNFRFGKDRPVNLNLRIEMSNVFNRTRLTLTNTSGFQARPTTDALGRYTGGFGTIVPITGTQGFRTGVIVARLQF